MAKYYVDGGCVLCLVCFYECKAGAIIIHENESVEIDQSKCVGCGKCYNNCQSEAIKKAQGE